MDSYDLWKTTPPEPKESHFCCTRCWNEFYPGDKYYDFDDEFLCPDCAKEHIEDYCKIADEEDCYGE